MSKRKKVTILIGVTILALLAIYWFIFRPTIARKICLDQAFESAVLSTQEYYPLDNIKRQDKQIELEKEFYLSCIRNKGLKE